MMFICLKEVNWLRNLFLYDIPKSDAKSIINKLEKSGIDIHVFTGDKKEAAEKFEKTIDMNVDVES